MNLTQNLINWDERLLLGIPVIDNQHRELITIVNRLHELSDEDHEYTGYMFLHSAYATVDFMRYHFNTEEKLMKLLDYPDTVEHKNEHEKFLTEILGKSDKFYDEREIVPRRFTIFLKDWIRSHFLDYDIKLAEYVLNRRQKDPIETMPVEMPAGRPQPVPLFS